MAFRSVDDLYEVLGGFLQEAVASPSLRDRLMEGGGALRLQLSEPDAVIDISLTGDAPEIAFGESTPPAGSVMTMSADTAQQIFSGQATFVGAMERQELAITSDVIRFAPLVAPLSTVAAPIYVADLEQMGRADLL